MHDDTRDEWVQVSNLRVHLRVQEGAGDSDAPPLLLLHGGGLGSASLMYAGSVGPLAAATGGRVIAVDWPGYGSTDKPTDAPYTTEWYIQFLARLLDALGIETADLCGLSMGGGVALGFALAHPERVGRLILVCSYGLGGDVPMHPLANLMVRLPNADTLSWWGLRRKPGMMRLALRGVVADPDALPHGLIAEACRHVADADTARVWRLWQRSEVTWEGLRTNYLAQLPALAAPTLLIHGAEDRLVPAAYAERAHTCIPQSRLRLFPRCGHWPMREHPDAFHATVSAFLASVPTGRYANGVLVTTP